ncbi:MAG: hypothetical protein JW786_07990 [Desulfobacterales bacterium]|nr:hypothetical protein [Desulfobacterales bacterium]
MYDSLHQHETEINSLGKCLLSTANIMRTGRKVSVTRMELRNQGNVLIAVGTGAYIIG